MAIVHMKKLRLMVVRRQKDELLRDLMLLGCVQISEPDALLADAESAAVLRQESGNVTEVRSELTRLTAALKLLDKYAPVKSRLLSSRPEVTEADFLDDGAYRQELDAVAQLEELEAAVRRYNGEEAKLRSNMEALRPWQTLDLPLDLGETVRTRISLGMLPAAVDLAETAKALADAAPESQLYEISSDKEQHYVLLICLKEELTEAITSLRASGFTLANLNGAPGTAKQNIEDAQQQIADVIRRREQAETDIAAFAPARTKATYDFLSVIHDGTIGEVSVTLPLGSYHIEETKPPYGYIGTTESYDVTFAWDNELNDVVMATSIAKYDGAASSQSFEVVRSKDANADFTEQQTLKFHNDREKAKVGVYKVDSETGNYLAGAVFNLYTADDIYSADGKLLFAAGELVATSPETGADGYTYFDCDVPIRGEYYGSSIRKDATTNSGNYIVKELRAPLGYYVNEEPMEVTFTYDGQAVMVLDTTCSNKPTEMWVSKRDLTNDEELPGATLAIKDTDGNTVTTWVSTDEPHRVTGLHFGESYTLTEIRAADGYALANDITFRLIQKSDEDGNHLEECEVYYLTTKNILFWKWDDWKLLDDATVIMQDDITKVQISKKDLTTNEELPGAELVIKDKDGTEIDRWISTNGPHYVEKMPAGDYTLTEITAPNGYKVAESIDFTVLPTGEMQTVVMKDAREDTPTPTPDNTPTPDHTPQPTPNTTPAPTPVPAAPTATPTPLLTIPKTGDNSSLGLQLAIAGISLAGLAVLVHKSARRKDIAPRDDDDEDTED